MFATTLSRSIFSIAKLVGIRSATKATPRGPLPSWINDRQLSEQLLKDTGLSPEDLGGSPTYDDRKPFFMQSNFG
ncbi:hypothetical protein [Marivita geojedonensis]|uniref:Uncharacterized protein n=1 Tax=Marivita geojedonensis TaxID=1123756 RepID=A0A1X4N9R1_9RHOB|nr:hypothetical protein [Marivita geojedonensis]OSQ43027.1 hypothetical protein MGEO_20025 [Marivita geojedonensis]PRY78449.1 hypothetical protein CLV76_1066 [Marivita geojedonensis]